MRNYHQFSILKVKCFGDLLKLPHSNKIPTTWFYEEIITFYQFNTNPLFPPFFYYMLGAKLGVLLYRDVSVM